MKRAPSYSRTAVAKRIKKKIKKFVTAFSSENCPRIPQSYFESQPNCSDHDHKNGDNDGIGGIQDIDFLDSFENVAGGDNIHDDDGNDDDLDNYDNMEDVVDDYNDSDHDVDDDNDNVDDDNDDDNDNDDDDDDDDIHVNSGDNNTDDVNDTDNDRLNANVKFLSTENIPISDTYLIAKRHMHVKDHLLSALAISVRHHLTLEATIDQLKWMKAMYHKNSIPTNKDQFWKALGRNDHCLIRHYYCKKCDDYLGEKCSKTKKLLKQCSCGACGPDDELESDLGYFIYISLRTQINELLSIPEISKSLKYRFNRIKIDPDAYEDIYDGEAYKSLCLPGKFLEQWYNFSFTINTDGCQVAKSSNSSAWPVYVEINELPPHMRKRHMLLAAIYVDTHHPLMNNLFRPFTDEMQNLYTTGIKWKPSDSLEITSKFIITTFSLDAPARALVTCMNQYNGAFGCSYCYAKGKSLGRGKFVYPLSQSYKKQRTDAEFRDDMAYAFRTGETRHGVKTISFLIVLPLFNVCKGVVVEAMHAVYLGVIQRHTQLLLGKFKNKQEPYYVGSPTKIKLIDECLLSITPPSCRSRTPRSITTYPKWKASEWRNWLDYAPVCLQSVLPTEYVNHLALLSQAIHYLNSDSITPHNLNLCENLLKEYVRLFENYFGVENMTFNMHSLTHLVQVVRNWGPIWVHEAFIFESWNKKIMDYVTSPYARAEQIATRFLTQKFLISTVYDDTVSPETKQFISQQIKIPVDKKDSERNRLIGLGKCTNRSPTDDELTALNRAGYESTCMKCYKKMKLNSVKYDCQTEEKLKFCNSIIYDGNGTFGMISTIAQFDYGDATIGGIFIKTMHHNRLAFNSQFINQVTPSDELVFIKESPFIKPAIKIATKNNIYILRQANCWETD